MAKKSANIMVRVEPEVKAKAEAVMSELGVPASVVVNMLYKHIIRTGGIPFPVSLTQEGKLDNETSSVVKPFPVKDVPSEEDEENEVTEIVEKTEAEKEAEAAEAAETTETPINIPGLRAPSGAKKIITILG